MLSFAHLSHQLDNKNNKHEKIFKIARNINIESKRIIYQLQRLSQNSQSSNDSIEDVKLRLKNLQQLDWRIIAQELKAEDHHKFLKAYTNGLQEYIEAVAFCYYLENTDLVSLDYIEKTLEFSSDEGSFHVVVPFADYLAGIADFTGELMKKSISSASIGNLKECYAISEFLQCIYNGYQLVMPYSSRELYKKLSILKKNLEKVEQTCYTISLYGSELPSYIFVNACETELE